METMKLTIDRIKAYLAEGKRFDERAPEAFRDITIETGVSKKAEGSARVRLGKTEVIAGVKMNVVEPYPDSPDQGNLMVTAELLPLSSSRFENGPPKIDAIELGRVIDRGIRESKFIDTSGLVIKKGEKVWNLFIDIYSINDDGNLMDAGALAALVALATAKIPKYDEKEEKVLFGEWTDKSIPLHKNIPLSFTVHKIGKKILIDPTREEEDASESRITMAISDGNVLHSMQKGNDASWTPEEFAEALALAEKSYKTLYPLVSKHFK